MASANNQFQHVTTQAIEGIIIPDATSDYGSDLDEADIEDLFSQSHSQPLQGLVIENIEEPTLTTNHGRNEQRYMARLPASQQSRPRRESHEAAVAIEYDESNCTTIDPAKREEKPPSAEHSLPTNRNGSEEPEVPDTRTPIARFRTRPMKPLSVTDIVSPAWCELQYWYNLTKYGRVKRTPAMKQGSTVHKTLEDQVHTHVPVEVTSKEDRFALRIWNMIQGLRTLRMTGLTRELELWGIVDGEVVNGIIDEITTTCPDEAAEEAALQRTQDDTNPPKTQTLPVGQRTLTDFLTSSQSGSVLQNSSQGWLGTLHEEPLTIYLVDIKTRQSKSLPSAPSQLKPVQMQLMLYHRFFSALAANEVPAAQVFERYGVNPDELFSDTFLAQLAQLDHSSLLPDVTPDDMGPMGALGDPFEEIMAHSTLTSLWDLLIAEFALTAPSGSISPLLTAEYRTPVSGELMGRRSFAFDAQALDAYAGDEMKWWKGERAVKGVEVEEAFKCRMCDFAEKCDWRKGKVEEGLQKAKVRKEGRKTSQV